jgi:K+-transporting ATPase ATPase C chain
MFREQLEKAFVALVALSVLTGVVYPLFVTVVAQLVFPAKADGSLFVVDGVVRGSELVGQDWRGEGWFHGRPSATGPTAYVPLPSTGSNLGPTNPALATAFTERAAALRAEGVEGPLPVQVARVARARGLDPARVQALVDEHVEGRFLGLLGERRVNVLALNLALDSIP